MQTIGSSSMQADGERVERTVPLGGSLRRPLGRALLASSRSGPRVLVDVVNSDGEDGSVQSTRSRLLTAAADLLDEGGPAAVTLREVGRRAGVSHNAPYKHFDDKEAILSAIATQALDELTVELRRAIDASAAPVAAMAAVGRAYVDWAGAHPTRFKLTFGPWAAAGESLGVAARTARATFLEPFTAAAEQGALARAAEDAAALVWAVAHGAVDLDFGGHLEKDGLSLRPHDLVDLQIATMTVPGRAGRGSPEAG